jgi:hypothetical protein
MYKIWLHGSKGISSGWWGGHGRSRSNSVIYDRTDRMEDVFELDEYNAVQFYAEFKKLGWSCEIIPKISNEKMLELLIR